MLQIETSFIAEISETLNLDKFKTIVKRMNNAKKKRIFDSIELSKIAKAALETFKTDDFQQRMASAGISWKTEEFIVKTFGFQKSYFYKLCRLADIPEETIESFMNDAKPEDAMSIEELLKYAKQQTETGGDADGEGGEGETEQADKPTQVLKVVYVTPQGEKLEIKVSSDGTAKVNGEKAKLNEVIEMLKKCL